MTRVHLTLKCSQTKKFRQKEMVGNLVTHVGDFKSLVLCAALTVCAYMINDLRMRQEVGSMKSEPDQKVSSLLSLPV